MRLSLGGCASVSLCGAADRRVERGDDTRLLVTGVSSDPRMDPRMVQGYTQASNQSDFFAKTDRCVLSSSEKGCYNISLLHIRSH